jgi:hypothetical protein
MWVDLGRSALNLRERVGIEILFHFLKSGINFTSKIFPIISIMREAAQR